jgi:hypothetical protein
MIQPFQFYSLLFCVFVSYYIIIKKKCTIRKNITFYNHHRHRTHSSHHIPYYYNTIYLFFEYIRGTRILLLHASHINDYQQ